MLGVLLGIVVLTNHGFAFWPWPGPHGNSWDQYRLAAHLVAHPDDTFQVWPTWRLSLYPTLLALLGEGGDYPAAATLVSSTAATLMVLAAGLGARALATPVAGGIAALTVALIPEVLQGVILMDPYPLLGATYGLGVALAACAARWPHPAVAALAGLWAGLSWGVDSRGALAVGLAAPLVLLGASRRGGAARLGPVVAFLLAAAVGPVAQHLLRPPAQVRLEAEDIAEESATIFGKLGDQREHAAMEVEQLVRDHPGHALTTPCAQGLPRQPGLDPCSRAVLEMNVRDLRAAGNLPPAGFLALLPLALLPVGPLRRGRSSPGPTRGGPSHGGTAWRSSLASVLALVLPLLVGVPLLAFVVARGGYLFQLYVALAMVPAVAVARLAARLPLPRAARHALGLLALPVVLLLWPTWPSARDARPSAPAPETGLAAWLDQAMGPQDSLLDCSGSGIAVLLLPRDVHPPGTRGSQRCDGRRPMARAAGVQWMLAPHDLPQDPEDLGWTPAWPEDRGLVTTLGPYRLYRSPAP